MSESYLEHIPKIDRIIDPCFNILPVKYLAKSKKYVKTIIWIPDELWKESKNILPDEKPKNTIGRPVVSYRKVLDGIMFILRTGCQWKMLPKEYGSGSTCHRRYQE